MVLSSSSQAVRGGSATARAARERGQRTGRGHGLMRHLKPALLALGLSCNGALAAEAAPASEPQPASKPAPAPGPKAAPQAVPTLSFDELTEAFGWNFDATLIKAEKIADGLYVLFGNGGNIGVSVGAQGTLLVDNQFPQIMPKIEAALRNLGGDGSIDFAINTHWHFDHANGNLALGPKGTWLVAQEASRERMLTSNLINLVSLKYEQPAFPEAARPTITFGDGMRFYFNGEELKLWHFGPAHTTGDTVVYFTRANAIHMGDVFNAGYPFIDVDNGGDIDGVISFCEAVLLRINPETTVIPGHGPVQDYQSLIDYIDMLRTVRNRIAGMVDQGVSLTKVIASKPTSEFDERYGDPSRLINRAYHSIDRLKTRALRPLEGAGAE